MSILKYLILVFIFIAFNAYSKPPYTGLVCTDKNKTKKLVSESSSSETYLVKTWYKEKAIAQPTAISDIGSNTFNPGLNIIKMPTKPKMIADHLLQPNFSFSMINENIATINGPLAKMAWDSISPIFKKQ